VPHFLLTPVGSSGDVHPFIGIGRVLRTRGHDVTLVTAEPFREVAERAGLRFVTTHSTQDFDRVSQHPDLWHKHKGLRLVLQSTASVMRLQYERIQDAYEPRRTVLVGHALGFAARLFEEKHKVPAATIQLAPSVFRSDYEQPAYIPGRDGSNWPRWLKRALWWGVDRLLVDPNIVPELNRIRHDLGLAPVSRVFKAWLHSPQRVIALFPNWFGPPQPDWPMQLRFAGFPLYDEADQHALAPGLLTFLDKGSPPIVFTPGSANRAATAFFRAAVDATQKLGMRAVLLTKYAEQVPSAIPPTIHHEPYVPLSQLLTRCAALVHHGGIGTCAQALAAGVPQLVMPLGFDQPDNTTRLLRLGVARWLAPGRFTGWNVSEALKSLLQDGSVAEHCGRWAAAVSQDHGIDDACTLLEEVASGLPAATVV
jgi:rhamnosyltransferase subunit B